MSYRIIVAKYDEPINWLLKEKDHCIIYNKGAPLDKPNNIGLTEIDLPNVGRESDTYLQYIISNYDDLPDVVVFTQARISDHKRHNNPDILINLKDRELINANSSFKITRINRRWNVSNAGFFLKNNYKHNTPILFGEWFTSNISKTYPVSFKGNYYGIFAVRKQAILSRPISFYKKILEEISHHSDPAEGHFFERSWYYIFNPDACTL